MAMEKEQHIGQQYTAFEQPDIIHLKLSGVVTFDECRKINEYHLAWGQDLPLCFFMIDLVDLKELSATVRKEASSTVKLLPMRGMVVYNAPLHAKVLAKLLLTAANLFRGSKEVENPVHFADKEADARAWIESRRQAIAAAA